MAVAQTIGLANNMESTLESPTVYMQSGMPSAPGQMTMTCKGLESEKVTQLLCSTNSIQIHQKMDLLEAVTQGCCERKNQYKIMDDKEATILTAMESSSGCTRCCCAPYHSTMVYINDPEGNTLLSIERQGCQFPCPQKCLGNGCPTCMDCCKDGIAVYNGKVEGDPGSLEGEPQPIFYLKEAMCGGEKCLWPRLYVHKGGEEGDAVGNITGPFIFGGCSELCMTATWNMESSEGKSLAEIVHMTPKSAQEVCAEICTDVDRFKINFTADAGQMDRTTALAGSLLVDYMFFEMDNGMLACKGGNELHITCCFMNCCGAQCPCKCTCQKDQKGDGGSGDTE